MTNTLYHNFTLYFEYLVHQLLYKIRVTAILPRDHQILKQPDLAVRQLDLHQVIGVEQLLGEGGDEHEGAGDVPEEVELTASLKDGDGILIQVGAV